MNTGGIIKSDSGKGKQPGKPSRVSTMRAAFLDRDGVINEEKDYLFRWDDFEYIPGAIEALQLLTNDSSTLVIVITGQSGIGRGRYSECDFQLLTNKMTNDLLQQCVYIDGIWYCPHLPEHETHKAVEPYNQKCTCRKPKTGLISAAVEHFQDQGIKIDLNSSCMFGDKTADIKSGESAGCKTVLVETGYGGKETKDRYDVSPDYKAPDLLAGVRWWLGK